MKAIAKPTLLIVNEFNDVISLNQRVKPLSKFIGVSVHGSRI